MVMCETFFAAVSDAFTALPGAGSYTQRLSPAPATNLPMFFLQRMATVKAAAPTHGHGGKAKKDPAGPKARVCLKWLTGDCPNHRDDCGDQHKADFSTISFLDKTFLKGKMSEDQMKKKSSK